MDNGDRYGGFSLENQFLPKRDFSPLFHSSSWAFLIISGDHSFLFHLPARSLDYYIRIHKLIVLFLMKFYIELTELTFKFGFIVKQVKHYILTKIENKIQFGTIFFFIVKKI